jgi:hypothetical protein
LCFDISRFDVSSPTRYNALANYTHDNKRYSWSLNLKALLDTTDFEQLWTATTQCDLISQKQNILDRLKFKLRQADIDRALSSNSLQYLTALKEEERITGYFHLGIQLLRVLAQLRLNQTKFYWKSITHELQHEDNCSFCNLKVHEDLFHFLIECKIHRESQNRFLNPLQLNLEINRENLLRNIININDADIKKVVLYIIVALNRRKWFNDY